MGGRMSEKLKVRTYKGLTAIERVYELLNYNEETGCSEWQGYLNDSGYGRCRLEGKKQLVHRFVYKYHNGEIQKGLCVLHKCDNPKCCNIEHLYTGTEKDNALDMRNRKRQWLQRAKTQGLRFSIRKGEMPNEYQKI